MDHERRIAHLPLSSCSEADLAFRLHKHTGLDLHAIPAKYGDSVQEARRLCEANLQLSLVWQCFDIGSIDREEDTVELAAGGAFSDKMPPRILEHAAQVVCFVSTLARFNQLRDSTPDEMVNYFIDAWGTVYAECGQTWLENRLRQELAGSGQRCTAAWNPGQFRFDLYNQRLLFRLLRPEEIGCELDKHLRMIPFKSTSGIIGLVAETLPTETDLLPCDFCSLGQSCPASKSKRRHPAV